MIPNALIAGLGRPATRLLLVGVAVVAGVGSLGIALAWSAPVALALIAVTAEPAPVWLAIPGLLVVSLLVLLYAAAKVRRIEVNYSE